ncbi:hypothetical protein MPSEU_000321000 [Mayamaea pseudoterrestris]|nr:hypothetical protein MPSEU_000321000 [Mayamaea pseudoterrestris]
MHVVPVSKSVPMQSATDETLNNIQDIIGQDAGNRGMKHLIVPGDFVKACRTLAHHHHHATNNNNAATTTNNSITTVIILSGFPCCVGETPPTETDGPPGACALSLAALELGSHVVLVTDDCNRVVFEAAAEQLLQTYKGKMTLETFPVEMKEADIARMQALSNTENSLMVAIERSGPAADGQCYTMKGIDMKELTAPIHNIVLNRSKDTTFIAIGDGGNELGMGKVIDMVHRHIPNGEKVGCVVQADLLIAASVSNWGGHALAAGAALVRAEQEAIDKHLGEENRTIFLDEWMKRCSTTEQNEVELLNRCVEKCCRDGVSGKVEATVDGMSLETSLECLRDIRAAASKR